MGISTLVEFLAKKGHQVEATPNAKITPEQYALLSGAFAAEREVKENADKIELMGGEAVTIDANTKAEEEAKKLYKNKVLLPCSFPVARFFWNSSLILPRIMMALLASTLLRMALAFNTLH